MVINFFVLWSKFLSSSVALLKKGPEYFNGYFLNIYSFDFVSTVKFIGIFFVLSYFFWVYLSFCLIETVLGIFRYFLFFFPFSILIISGTHISILYFASLYPISVISIVHFTILNSIQSLGWRSWFFLLKSQILFFCFWSSINIRRLFLSRAFVNLSPLLQLFKIQLSDIIDKTKSNIDVWKISLLKSIELQGSFSEVILPFRYSKIVLFSQEESHSLQEMLYSCLVFLTFILWEVLK